MNRIEEQALPRSGTLKQHFLYRTLAHSGDGQPRQRSGKFGDVGLRLAGADTQRTQFKYLARQIFVESQLSSGNTFGELTARTDGLRLIEIEQHRGMTNAGKQQVGKLAHDAGPDSLKFIISGERDYR